MIKKTINNHKTIISNTFFLSVIQVVKMVSPFVALPYVIKTIGADNYGNIVFAQSIVAIFVIFINFGLDISAVKNVAQNRDNKQALSVIVSSVLGLKWILALIVFVVYVLVVILIPKFNHNIPLFLIVFCGVIPEIIFPVWYYQGMEKMKLITYTSLISVLFYITTLFIFVKTPDDYLIVPILQISGLIVSALIGLNLLIRVDKIRIIIPTFEDIKRVFKESVPFFASRLSVVVNSNLANLVIGFYLGMTDVAAYELAKKIVSASEIPIHMLNQAIYPHNARNRNSSFAKKAFYLIIGVSFLISASIFIFAPFIVDYFAGNEQLKESIYVIRYLAPIIVVGSIGLYLGTPMLVAWGYPKPFNMSVIFAVLLLMVIYVALYNLNAFSLETLAFSSVIVSMSSASYRYYFCRKYKIL